jgi:hypothetical protein
MPITPLSVLAALLLPGAAPVAFAQHEEHAGHEHLGTVHFETSCNEKAQQEFDRGMKYQHSFWYRESKKAVEAAL